MTKAGTRNVIALVSLNSATHRDVLPNYPNLGLLTLGTAVKQRCGPRAQILYFDGPAMATNAAMFEFVRDHGDQIAVLGLCTFTSNYAECIELAKLAKGVSPEIVTVVGNDHFSALYESAMRRREGIFDYGFYGTDVVEGFAQFVDDVLRGGPGDPAAYPGLVHRDVDDPRRIHRNPENHDEFTRLPLVDYSLADTFLPHLDRYARHQATCSHFGGRKATSIDIARGCLKFAGERTESGVPLNACEFCAILPGGVSKLSMGADRAWEVIRNAVEQGFSYLQITADELPLTFWPLISSMIERKPEWYRKLSRKERPIIYCAARADAFRERARDRIGMLVNELNVVHFFVGLEALTSTSLHAMNKGIRGQSRKHSAELAHDNLLACAEIDRRGGRLTAGLVLTHLGITPQIMEENLQLLKNLLEKDGRLFAEIFCDLSQPLPGSLSFEGLRNPDFAIERARGLGLRVNETYLRKVAPKYQTEDLFYTDELITDHLLGCCPDVSIRQAWEFYRRTEEALQANNIVSKTRAKELFLSREGVGSLRGALVAP